MRAANISPWSVGERVLLVQKTRFCTLPIRLGVSPGFRPRPSLRGGLLTLRQRAFALCRGSCGNLWFGRMTRRTIFASWRRLAVMHPAALQFNGTAGRLQGRRGGIGTWSPRPPPRTTPQLRGCQTVQTAQRQSKITLCGTCRMWPRVAGRNVIQTPPRASRAPVAA